MYVTLYSSGLQRHVCYITFFWVTNSCTSLYSSGLQTLLCHIIFFWVTTSCTSHYILLGYNVVYITFYSSGFNVVHNTFSSGSQVVYVILYSSGSQRRVSQVVSFWDRPCKSHYFFLGHNIV